MSRFVRGVAICAAALVVSCSDPEKASPVAQRPTNAPTSTSTASAEVRNAALPPGTLAPPTRPNILLVVIDTLRYSDSQLDPDSDNPTPFLLELRQRGVNFTRAYTPADSTPPAHFTLLTGYLHGWQGRVDRREASMGYQLTNHGYDTFGIAANGNLSAKAHRAVTGFERYTCLQDVYEELPDETKAKDIAKADETIRRWGGEPNDWYRLFVWSSADKVFSRLRDELVTTRRPFFGFLNLIDVHDPYFPDAPRANGELPVAPLRYRQLSPELADPDSVSDPRRRTAVKAKIAEAQGRPWSVSLDLTPAQLAAHRRLYRAEIREFDTKLRYLFTLLERRKLINSTIVILTSDHGEAFGERDLITHSFNNLGDRESTNHVPLLMLFPPAFRIAPQTIGTPVTLADVAPTVYDITGVDWSALAAEVPQGQYGRSLWTALRKTPATPKSVAVVPPSKWTPASPTKQQQQDEEAKKRLKSLGYIQ